METANQNAAVLAALRDVASVKGLTAEQIVSALSDAIVKALTKDDPDMRVEVVVDPVSGSTSIVKLLKIVASSDGEDFDDINEISLADAQKTMPDAKEGEDYPRIIRISDMGDESVRHVVQLFKQRVTELGNALVASKWGPHIGEVVYAEVEPLREPRIGGGAYRGDYSVNLTDERDGSDPAAGDHGYLRRSETIPGEKLESGQKYYFVIKDVKEQSRGWPVILSRTDERLLMYFLTENVTEIADGAIEVRKIVRAPGVKAKVAVTSRRVDIDPVRAVLGPRGDRVKAVSSQLHGELIDVLV